MNRTSRVDAVTGMVLLLLPILSILGFLVGIPLGELDPFSRSDLEEILETIHEHRELYALSLSAFVVQDVLVIPPTAALLYLAFRDRSHPLALVFAFGMVASAACFAVHEVGVLALAFLAEDFAVSGGPAGVGAGDPLILEAARTVSVIQGSTALMGQTAIALALTSLGLLLGWSPPGEKVPSRWLGCAAIGAGLCYLSTWTFFLSHTVGGIATLLGEVAILLVMTVLGIWFLRAPGAVDETVTPRHVAHPG